jgi:ParB-like chromosome segregation protein Spo0J
VTNEEVQTIPIQRLQAADSPRLIGEDGDHIRTLAESDEALPPILVHRATMRVIDGMHRLRAARLRGEEHVEVKFFDGTAEGAFVLAVKANIAHGLPLTFADRESAVTRIVRSHSHWSDRVIAAATGLGPRTVAAIRRRSSPVSHPPGEIRIGLDGRARPLNGADGRRAAGELIAQRPDVSLREIAKATGISPMTARDVRERVHRGQDPVPPGQQLSKDQPRTATPSDRDNGGARPLTRDSASILQNLKIDPALRFNESGRVFLRWLFRHAVGPEEWRPFVTTAPPHCAYVVAALARACGNEWLEFAKQLEEQLLAGPDIA